MSAIVAENASKHWTTVAGEVRAVDGIRLKAVMRALDEAARIEGCRPLAVLWEVYVPFARPVYLAYALVSVSYHWNNFLWPLIITNSVEARPLTVGLQVFSTTDQRIDWSITNGGRAAHDRGAADRVLAVPRTIRTVLHEGLAFADYQRTSGGLKG